MRYSPAGANGMVQSGTHWRKFAARVALYWALVLFSALKSDPL